ncbi:MAG: lysophospholipase [Actinomycetota bacterium]|nr:lysophospholipase [Actinomycetota bacterium]
MPRVVELPARGETRAVVVVLHGGMEKSHVPTSRCQTSSLRMIPFARALHRAGRQHGVAVWRVRYRVRGWNGEDRAPVADARAALDEVTSRYGEAPVFLVGHSMGGRTAVHVLEHPRVVGMVGLAPWLPNDPVDGIAGKDVLIAHGTRDTTTSPKQTQEWSERARRAGATVTYANVVRSGHTLLRRSGLWTDLTTGFALRALGIETRVGPTARRVLDQPDGTVTV